VRPAGLVQARGGSDGKRACGLWTAAARADVRAWRGEQGVQAAENPCKIWRIPGLQQRKGCSLGPAGPAMLWPRGAARRAQTCACAKPGERPGDKTGHATAAECGRAAKASALLGRCQQVRRTARVRRGCMQRLLSAGSWGARSRPAPRGAARAPVPPVPWLARRRRFRLRAHRQRRWLPPCTVRGCSNRRPQCAWSG
jgi:hypothetical protein